MHRATAARWIVSAREALVDETKRQLRGRLGVSGAELDSLLGLVRSQIHVSLNRLL